MSLLAQYIPEPPAIVAQIQANAQEAIARDQQRAAVPTLSEYERYADNVISGLARLVAEAQAIGIDFETVIHEISLEERDLKNRIQESRKLLPKKHEIRAMPPDDPRRQALPGLKSFIAIMGKVREKYQEGHQKLETIRDLRLAAYATEWENYLSRLEKTTSVADAVRKVWSHLKPRLWAPEASPTDDGDFIIVWDRGPHHLQVRILTSGRYDWFYRNRETNEVLFEEDLVLDGQYSNLDAIVSRIA
jgi:hypothetical protein